MTFKIHIQTALGTDVEGSIWLGSQDWRAQVVLWIVIALWSKIHISRIKAGRSMKEPMIKNLKGEEFIHYIYSTQSLKVSKMGSTQRATGGQTKESQATVIIIMITSTKLEFCELCEQRKTKPFEHFTSWMRKVMPPEGTFSEVMEDSERKEGLPQMMRHRWECAMLKNKL